MDIQRKDMEILNELSESISLKMKSVLDPIHSENWLEHKVHSDYDLWFIQYGTIQITIKGITQTAKQGDLVFFYPGTPYMATTNDKECQFIYVHFDFGIGKQQRILNDFQLSGIIPSILIEKESLRFSQYYFDSKQENNTIGNRLYLKAHLIAVVAKIIELYGRDQYLGSFVLEEKLKKSEKNLDLLQPIFHYVNKNIHQSIKMHELAQLVGISEKYFITYFKKTLGITPGQYIYQIRMNRAREYLSLKKYTIQEISTMLGYPDPFTFSKAFKKYFDVPPSKFE